jgi:hypothetical protein
VNGHAGDLGASQRLADSFGLITFKTGEAGAKQRSIVLGDNRFGEWIGLREQTARLTACGFDALLGFAFALERANLNDPSGVADDRLRGAALLNSLRL